MRLHRLACSTIISRSGRRAESLLHSSSRRWVYISTTPRGLLISWATPAASWPMLASRSECIRVSWALASFSLAWVSLRMVLRLVSMTKGRHISLSAKPLAMARACSRQVW